MNVHVRNDFVIVEDFSAMNIAQKEKHERLMKRQGFHSTVKNNSDNNTNKQSCYYSTRQESLLILA